MFFTKPARTLATVAAATFSLAILPGTATAQGFFDSLWGGEPEWGGKRQTVNFPTKYSARQIVVSFGDRRLYLITKKGKALSYPIAVPRQQSRWSGITNVSMKRENPAWTPTPEMMKENPRLPPWVPGGHPHEPAWCARALSWFEHLSHSRNGRSVDDRQRRSRRAASACTIRMCLIFIRVLLSARR